MLNLISFMMMMPPQGAGGEGAQGGGGLFGGGMTPLLILMVGMIAIMYFFSIRPQRKRQKEHQEMLSNLNVGDKVITTAAMYGKIAEKKEKTVIIDFGNGTKIEMDQNAIVDKQKD
jgi:preprotein translocase subunit YajC